MSSCKHTHKIVIRFAFCPHTEVSNKDTCRINFAIDPWQEAWFALLEMSHFNAPPKRKSKFGHKNKRQSGKWITEWSCRGDLFWFLRVLWDWQVLCNKPLPTMKSESRVTTPPRDPPARQSLKPSASSNTTKIVIMLIVLCEQDCATKSSFCINWSLSYWNYRKAFTNHCLCQQIGLKNTFSKYPW